MQGDGRFMVDAPIKIGFVGGGMIAQIGHLPFYLDDPRCEVACIAESRPSLVDALARQLGAARLVKDHKALLANPDIKAVVISVPRAATGPLTLEALEAGKHVMAEKPMAHSVEQTQRLVDAATARNLIYAVGFMKRNDPGVRAAKALVDEVAADGRLGRMLLARFYDFSNAYAIAPPPHARPAESRTERFPVWPLYPDWLPEQYRGIYPWFLNVASHDLNLLRLFFPRDVEALSAHCDGTSSVVATLRQGDTNIVLEITKTAAGRWVEGADFLFERGQIRLAIPSPMATGSVTEVRIDDERRGLVNEAIATGTGWSFARQAENFIDALTGAAQPATSGAEGLADMVLTEQIWRRMTV
jgi:predicted dehydrogenase